ncbi:MAG TPA: calcium-translocating P-type ATPase, PMCA-type, partial [Bacillota bacterium]|nr:calcium-translocating P-type ATPase, PMCA-type [Bacillota bacterium]
MYRLSEQEKSYSNSIGPRGLTQPEVDQSRKRHGSNQLTRHYSNSFFKQYLESFGDPIIKILLFALAANVLMMLKNVNWFETIGIGIAIFIATFVSTLSEYGSESAFEKLQEDAAQIKCRVKRAGGVYEIPIGDIVVGDLVVLQAGDRIPADGRLVSGSLSVDQSALNGESKEAKKYPSDMRINKKYKGPRDFLSPHEVFRGSVVCLGEGIMVTEAVGERTFYGRVAVEIQAAPVESPLKLRLKALAKTICHIGYAAAGIVIVANLFYDIFWSNNFNPVLIGEYFSNRGLFIRDLFQTITLAITVLVMAVPEGLPMMITVVLSSNMKRMLKDNVLVRKLVGIETSGNINVLFTDKTGTLTKGKLSITSFIDGFNNEYSPRSIRKQKGLYDLFLTGCFYNNSSHISKQSKKTSVVGGNATDRALMEFVMRDIKNIPKSNVVKIIPFDSSNKFSSAQISGLSNRFLLKGAPEKLLPHCKFTYDRRGKKSPLHNTYKLTSYMNKMAKQSIRLLAICTSDSLVARDEDLDSLTLVGLVCIKDAIRSEAKKAVREVTSAGIQVVMITGDNKETATAIAKEAGLIRYDKEDQVCTSTQLNDMSDSEVIERLGSLRVIARALPSDKSRMVRIAQRMGLVVGMTGDGINDAPALKKADVGFAMGSGTEVAKEAGDIIILDNNFSSIGKAILYGRTIFKSIRKFITLQLMINLSAVGISIIGPFIGIEEPVTIIQMLWINIVMDTLAGLAFAGEAPLPEYMRERPKRRDEPIMNRYMYSQIVFTGIYTVSMCVFFLKSHTMQTIFGYNT